MLILENLTLQAAKKSFSAGTQKVLKISINEHIAATKEIAKIKSPTLLEWTQPIALPLFHNAQYTFEITEKHSFGYNPEQLNLVMSGKIVVGEQDSYNNWEVLTDRHQKYGFLSATIRRKLRYAPNASTAPPESQMLIVSSIVAHLNLLKQKRAFLQFQLLGRTYKTDIAKSKAGELLFTQQINIEKTDLTNQMPVEVYSYDAKQEKAELVGSGVMKLSIDGSEKRAAIRDLKGANIGEIFIDYKITSKEAYHTSRQLAKIVYRGSLLSRSTVQSPDEHPHKMAKSLLGLGQEQGLSRSRRLFNKPSVVHHNSNIFTPSEQRFMNYQDRQSPIVSYIREQKRDFDFKDKHSQVYYKGASIGKGDKHDFTSLYRGNPGVGDYTLPCIWDRY